MLQWRSKIPLSKTKTLRSQIHKYKHTHTHTHTLFTRDSGGGMRLQLHPNKERRKQHAISHLYIFPHAISLFGMFCVSLLLRFLPNLFLTLEALSVSRKPGWGSCDGADPPHSPTVPPTLHYCTFHPALSSFMSLCPTGSTLKVRLILFGSEFLVQSTE